jgi:hypothetical protein
LGRIARRDDDECWSILRRSNAARRPKPAERRRESTWSVLSGRARRRRRGGSRDRRTRRRHQSHRARARDDHGEEGREHHRRHGSVGERRPVLVALSLEDREGRRLVLPSLLLDALTLGAPAGPHRHPARADVMGLHERLRERGEHRPKPQRRQHGDEPQQAEAGCHAAHATCLSDRGGQEQEPLPDARGGHHVS